MLVICVLSGTEETVTAQIPEAGIAIPFGSEVLLYFGDDAENTPVAVPDFTGMNRQQASVAAGELGLYILVAGNMEVSPNVTVTAQSEPKDTVVPT